MCLVVAVFLAGLHVHSAAYAKDKNDTLVITGKSRYMGRLIVVIGTDGKRSRMDCSLFTVFSQGDRKTAPVYFLNPENRLYYKTTSAGFTKLIKGYIGGGGATRKDPNWRAMPSKKIPCKDVICGLKTYKIIYPQMSTKFPGRQYVQEVWIAQDVSIPRDLADAMGKIVGSTVISGEGLPLRVKEISIDPVIYAKQGGRLEEWKFETLKVERMPYRPADFSIPKNYALAKSELDVFGPGVSPF